MSIEVSNVFNIYSKIAHHFSSTRFSKWSWITEFVETFPNNSTICDIGCGNGRNMMYKNLNFIGIDSCSEFLEICKNKNLKVLLSDMCKLPLNSNSFDGIISIASFHHLSTKLRQQKALDEMYRILKDDGLCLLSVWSINQPKKTKRTFSNYGNNLVEWRKNDKVYNRFYYIFKIEEIKELIHNSKFTLVSHKWDCGNEIFILKKNLKLKFNY